MTTLRSEPNRIAAWALVVLVGLTPTGCKLGGGEPPTDPYLVYEGPSQERSIGPEFEPAAQTAAAMPTPTK